MSDFSQRIANLSSRKRILFESRIRSTAEAIKRMSPEPIAIIGMGCRFPRGANDPAHFWQLLRDGVDAITEIPADRWDVDLYYDPLPSTAGKMSTRWGGFLDQVDQFDALFFGISPREAVSMDPQHRLLLEVSWEALEDAGQAPDKLARSETGVFMGICTNDYSQLYKESGDLTCIDAYYGTGNAFSFVTGRLSYILGLQGPSIAVDTACSSSLVAVHLACQSLRTEECRLALAGGVNLILSPIGSIYVSQVRAVAADGHCKAFDASADGYVRGEGCGVIVLKRLSDAVTDGDAIHGIIRGSAVNQDGRSAGLTAPNGVAQENLIRKVLASAGVQPAQVDYIEAHGTGTNLGDPIEVRALAAAMNQKKDRSKPLAIGSVKTNIGHLEAAAGIAGLIKVVLALKHEEIPPHLHLKKLNPYISWDEISVVIPTERTPWPRGNTARIAGVSSFGFSGTNAHVVLEEAPAVSINQSEEESGMDREYLLPLSARSEQALHALARSYREFLTERAASLKDICYTAGVRRSHHEYRLALVVRTQEEAIEGLENYLRGEKRREVATGVMRPGQRDKVVFVYPGQGAQWWAMGRQLLEEEAVFRATMERCEEILKRDAGWSLLEELMIDEAESRLDSDNIEITQVALFGIQVGLTEVWRSWGIEPEAVIGHSMGEVAAAYTAGVLKLEEAMRVIYRRSHLLQAASQQGGMVAVELTVDEAERIIVGYEDQIAVAASNGPRSTVLSGETEALEVVVERLERQEIFTRRLRTTGVAGHSPQVEPMKWELIEGLKGLKPQRGTVRMVSTVTGDWIGGQELDAEYWGRNLREPVKFETGMRRLAEEGYGLFVEVSAHPILAGAIRENLRSLGREGKVLASLRRQERERAVMLQALARMYSAGYAVDWKKLYRQQGRCVRLPNYPWQRERFWIASAEAKCKPLIAHEDDIKNSPKVRRITENLMQRWGGDGAQAINRAHLAPFIFLGSTRRSFFYFDRKQSSITTLMYIGPDENYEALVNEMRAYTENLGLQVNLVAEECRAHVLRNLGFTTTPFGVLQTINDLKAFTLKGNRMRRLRYQVARYEKSGNCLTVEQLSRKEARTNLEVIRVIDEWLRHKGKSASFVSRFKEEILDGTLDPKYRMFITYRGDMIDAIVILSPSATNNGYLLDLEFYRPDAPLGCLEFAIVKIIEKLLGEGCSYLSLGGTFGTQLVPHPNADREVEELFATLHHENILNGDANFQFKSKFRPQITSIYLCRSLGSDSSNLLDVLMMLGDPIIKGHRFDTLVKSEEGTDPTERPDRKRLGFYRNAALSKPVHPLLGHRLRVAIPDILFESQLRVESLAFLNDHRILGALVLPGTAYLEMALAAAAEVFTAGAYRLKSVVIQEPMRLSIGEVKTVQSIVRLEGAREASLQIFSLMQDEEGDRSSWRLHANATVQLEHTHNVTPAPSQATFIDIRARCLDEMSGTAYYQWLAERGFNYGTTFQGIKHLWRKDGEVLGWISVPDLVMREARSYQLHPALLDSCLQIFLAALFGDMDQLNCKDMYLLWSIESLRFYGPPGTVLWSQAVLRKDLGGDKDIIAGDLRLFDETGKVTVIIEGLCARRTSREALLGTVRESLNDWLYDIHWAPKIRSDGKILQRGMAQQRISSGPHMKQTGEHQHNTASTKGNWLIFAGTSRVGWFLAEQLNSRGESCILVLPGQSYEAIGERLFRIDPTQPEHFERFFKLEVGRSQHPLRGVVDLWSLDVVGVEETTVAALEKASVLGCGSVLHLVQALVRSGLSEMPRLWLVTRGAQAVGAKGSRVEVGQAPLWGLGRVIATEHPEMWGGLVDLDAEASTEEQAELLLEELSSSDGENQIGFRGRQRYVARLVRSRGQQRATKQMSVHADGTYLITGGLGGLGLSVAQWMVERGARQLVLVGRSGGSSDTSLMVSELEQVGAKVRVAQVDVSQEREVERLLMEIKASMAPLRGIIHAAGIIDDGVLIKQGWEQFARVLAPKIYGAWNLHVMTKDAPLDFFILFSSAASLFGPASQGNHAAANAFLDALAHHRRSRDLRALSINWGVWTAVGAATRSKIVKRMAKRGLGTITPQQGLQVLEHLIQLDSTQVAAMPLDWRQWQKTKPTTGEACLLSDLIQEESGIQLTTKVPRPTDNHLFRDVVLALEPEQQRQSLESYLHQQIAKLLGISESKLDVQQPLNRLGFDSLMIVELRNRVEADLKVRLPIVEFFRNPSTTHLMTVVLNQVTSTQSSSSGQLHAIEDAEQL